MLLTFSEKYNLSQYVQFIMAMYASNIRYQPLPMRKGRGVALTNGWGGFTIYTSRKKVQKNANEKLECHRSQTIELG